MNTAILVLWAVAAAFWIPPLMRLMNRREIDYICHLIATETDGVLTQSRNRNDYFELRIGRTWVTYATDPPCCRKMNFKVYWPGEDDRVYYTLVVLRDDSNWSTVLRTYYEGSCVRSVSSPLFWSTAQDKLLASIHTRMELAQQSGTLIKAPTNTDSLGVFPITSYRDLAAV